MLTLIVLTALCDELCLQWLTKLRGVTKLWRCSPCVPPVYITDSFWETPQFSQCPKLKLFCSSIVHFCPQSLCCCSILMKKWQQFTPRTNLTYSSQVISDCSHRSDVKEISPPVNWTLGSSQVTSLLLLSCVACEDKEHSGWGLSSPAPETASPSPWW